MVDERFERFFSKISILRDFTDPIVRPRKIYRFNNTVIRGAPTYPTTILSGAFSRGGCVRHNQALKQCDWTTLDGSTSQYVLDMDAQSSCTVMQLVCCK